MKAALKEGDSAKLSVLRMVVSAVKTLEIDKNVKTAAEADILQILQKEVRQHRESIEQFRKGKREDLVSKEMNELKILESYLPRQLSEEEVVAIVKEAIADVGASAKSDMGKVMKQAMEKAKGRADGRAVNQAVMRLLK